MNKEYKLYQPLKDFWEDRGYEVFPEVIILNRRVDVGVIKENKIIAIEMKLALTGKVIRQAHMNELFADFVYVAILTNPQYKSIFKCRNYGIGIIQIKNDSAKIILEAQRNDTFINHRNTFLKRCRQSKNRIAGLPTLKGQGPRIECKKRVNKYIEKKPNAKWQEIFENVTNHYATYKSMASAIGNK